MRGSAHLGAPTEWPVQGSRSVPSAASNWCATPAYTTRRRTYCVLPRHPRSNVNADQLGPWSPHSVAAVHEVFRSAPFRWFIAGGDSHALELALGRAWRSHDDLDVGVCPKDPGHLHRHLSDRDLRVGRRGRLVCCTATSRSCPSPVSDGPRHSPTAAYRFRPRKSLAELYAASEDGLLAPRGDRTLVMDTALKTPWPDCWPPAFTEFPHPCPPR